MRPFPGKLKRTREGYQLNGWQRKWMHEVFPTHTNKEICLAIGICEISFRKLLRTLSDMEKDYDWRYYDRCKRIGKPQGCAVEHERSIQKQHSITIATKLSPRDYNLLCWVAKKNKKNKYVYLQELIRKALKAESPIKDGELFT